MTHATKLHGARVALAAVGGCVRWGVGDDHDRHQRALDHLLADLREQGGASA